MDTRKACVICQGEIKVEAISNWAGGYNAYPIAEGRCCRPCDDELVTPARMKQAFQGGLNDN